MTRRTLAAAVLLAAGMLTGCGTDAAAPPWSGADSVSTSSATAPGDGTDTVSANDATHAELVAALSRAGVGAPERWAAAVEDSRPHPSDDPTFAKLRTRLASSDPPADTLARVVRTLSLP